MECPIINTTKLLLLFCFAPTFIIAQINDSIPVVEDTLPPKIVLQTLKKHKTKKTPKDTTIYTWKTFNGSRVVNGHSLETQEKGILELLFAHRFGRVNGSFYQLFGLDQASMRMGFEYGITNSLTLGLGRSTLGKEYDFYVKYQFLYQKTGKNAFPFSATWLSTLAINTLKNNNKQREPYYFTHRLSFANQLMIARKFSERFSLMIMPTHVHLNFVEKKTDKNDLFAIGVATKVQVSHVFAVNLEFYYLPSGQSSKALQHSLSVGVDINTGNHLFQIHFSNSEGMIEKAFVTETTGNWLKGDVHIGFNMIRTFKLKGRRYH